MSAVIRLDHVLHEAVSTPYDHLVTRPTGAAVRTRVLQVLADVGAEAYLDFSAVGTLDYSCADEVVAKLLAAGELAPIPRVVLRGVREDHAEAIGEALTRHGFVILAVVDNGRPCLLGAVSDDAQAVVDALTRLGRAAAALVAEALAWSTPRALDTLEDLARRRCVLAHPDATFELGAVA